MENFKFEVERARTIRDDWVLNIGKRTKSTFSLFVSPDGSKRLTQFSLF